MIQLIAGESGTGKTKQMIEMANRLAENESQNVVYLDDDNRYIYDLTHKVRFTSLHEYPVRDLKGYLGFICGIISKDHDIEAIFIDGLFKMMKIDLEDFSKFIQEIKQLSQKFQIVFYVTANYNKAQLPEELKEYVVS
ncbi:ATP-binding protein [Clostridiaceae bacterium 35-E11]